MASCFSHAVAGLAVGAVFQPRQAPRRYWIAGAACAALPDLDFLGRYAEILDNAPLGHRALFHSLLFAVLLGAVVTWTLFRGTSWWRLWAYLTLATASHGLIDAFTATGRGVSLLSPFSAQAFAFAWRPIDAPRIGIGGLGPNLIATVVNEFAWVWLPSALVALVAILVRAWLRARTPAVAADPRRPMSVGDTRRTALGVTAIHGALQDVKYAWRSMCRAPGITIIAVATLAVGIGGATSVFSIVNSGLWRPVPYPSPEQLVALTAIRPSGGAAFSAVPEEMLEHVRRHARSYTLLAAFRDRSATLQSAEYSLSLDATEVDTALLALIGVKPQRGRLLTSAEIRVGAPVVLISDSLWRAAFGRSDGIVGQSIHIDQAWYAVVGIMPPGFRFFERSDIWLPFVDRPGATVSPVSVIGRLRSGVSHAQARAEAAVLGRQVADAYPAHFARWSLGLRDEIVDRRGGPWITLAVLFFGVTTCLLIIACVNIASLMLARAAERRREMAVRSSLGASRSRLIRQNLTESLLLGSAGGAGGVLIAAWVVGFIPRIASLGAMPSWIRLGVFDLRVLAFTVLVSLIAVALVGITPALEATRLDIASVLKAGTDTIGT